MLAKLTVLRASIFAGGIVVVAIVILEIFRLTTPPANYSQQHPSKITLVYVGAEDCGPCKVWQRDQGAAFRKSVEFRHLTYREVKSPSLFGLMKDKNWPEDLRVYRRNINKGAGAPLWLVIADNKVVIKDYGLSQWDNAVLPKIRSLLQ